MPQIVPFLLGFSLAILCVFICSVSTLSWACRGVDVSIEESCPRLLKLPRERKGIVKRLLGRRMAKDQFILLKPDPVEGSCRLLMSLFRYNDAMADSSTTCTPEITMYETTSTRRMKHVEEKSLEKFKTAFTSEKLQLTAEQKNLVQELGRRVEARVDDWRNRAANVPWGGSGPSWFDPRHNSGSTDMESLDGGLLYFSYLRIMNWPVQLHSRFPFKLCSNGCKSEMALDHTLEFREKFKPWLVSNGSIKENTKGCVFHHGFSPTMNEDENGAHSLVSSMTILTFKISSNSTKIH